MNRDRIISGLYILAVLVLFVIAPVVFSIVSTRNSLHRLREAYPEYDFRWRIGLGVQVYVNGTWLYLDEWRR